jgi:tetratricopeptide (TPR) repeat protein
MELTSELVRRVGKLFGGDGPGGKLLQSIEQEADIERAAQREAALAEWGKLAAREAEVLRLRGERAAALADFERAVAKLQSAAARRNATERRYSVEDARLDHARACLESELSALCPPEVNALLADIDGAAAEILGRASGLGAERVTRSWLPWLTGRIGSIESLAPATQRAVASLRDLHAEAIALQFVADYGPAVEALRKRLAALPQPKHETVVTDVVIDGRPANRAPADHVPDDGHVTYAGRGRRR